MAMLRKGWGCIVGRGLWKKFFKKDYVIYTFPCTRSNGVRVLYLLANKLRDSGYNVYLYNEMSLSNCSYAYGFKCINRVTNRLRKHAIFVYPEVIVGNPLMARRVVRYVLYYPGVNGGEKKYHDSELIFTYLSEFYPEASILTVPFLDDKLFYNDFSVRTRDCYFVYKKGKFRDAPETNDLLEINMSYPDTREKLADLLRTTKTLYSYDDCTALLDEAMLCGVDVKIITQNGVEKYTSKYFENIKDFEKQLSYFIQITQNMFPYKNNTIEKNFKLRKRFIICIKKIVKKCLFLFEKYK